MSRKFFVQRFGAEFQFLSPAITMEIVLVAFLLGLSLDARPFVHITSAL